MARESDPPRSRPAQDTRPNAQELEGAIDRGHTSNKVVFFDPAASPLGTDDEAARKSEPPPRITTARRQGLEIGAVTIPSGRTSTRAGDRRARPAERARPVSPNIQIYRPQLTSVLSIANRLTGVVLSIGAVGLVAWLLAAASGPQAYAAVQVAISSWMGQVVLFGFTFAFFLHLCGGIRHLVWDTTHGFELRSIYLSGWVVVAASVLLTVAAWGASLFIGS
jgi:succinate dehydrogenase / fumarate reductase, cytochrome b subunit